MAFSVGSGTGTGAESSGGNTVPAIAGSACSAAGPPAVAPVNTGASTTARASAGRGSMRRIKLSAHSQNQPGTEPEKGRRAPKVTVKREGYREQDDCACRRRPFQTT